MEAWKRGWIEKQAYLRERERARRKCGTEHQWSPATFYVAKSAGDEWISTCSRCGSLKRELRARTSDGRIPPC